MAPSTIRAWSSVHSWTSLVCTVFLLMLCVTGLPLIFHDEIDAALNPARWQPAHPGGPLLALDQVLEIALERRPGEVPLFMSFDTDRPVVNVTSGPRPDAAEHEMHFASFDRTSGAVVPPAERGEAFMHFLLQLHTDLFLGLPGMLLLGIMGLLFVAAVVSGIVLYAPFMRRQPFGVLRVHRSPRLKWLDHHNLLGIVTVAWVLVVGLTGVVNTLATPIIALWKDEQLAELVAQHADDPSTTERSSLDAAVATARSAAPGMVLQFVAFPGGDFSTNHHYAVFLHGATPLTTHLVAPAIIDAATGELVAMRPMPWYSKALFLSKPLHFGDYGGLLLKVLWAALTIMTIVVLCSGLYLWLARHRAGDAEAAVLESIATSAMATTE
jgi:uncharacterized iron-regulated membrane protein